MQFFPSFPLICARRLPHNNLMTFHITFSIYYYSYNFICLVFKYVVAIRMKKHNYKLCDVILVKCNDQG